MPHDRPRRDVRWLVFSDVRGLEVTRLIGLLLASGPIFAVLALAAAPGQAHRWGDLAASGIVLVSGLAGLRLMGTKRELGGVWPDLLLTAWSLTTAAVLWLTNGRASRVDAHAVFGGIVVAAYLACSFRRAAVQHVLALASFSAATVAASSSGRVAIGAVLPPVFWYSAMGIIVGLQRRQNATLIDGLRRDAWVDRLTGVENRTAFLARANAAIERVGEGHRPAVLLVDIDAFKQINDSLGHIAGDAVLAEVGNRLNEIVDDDAPNRWASRLGADEFALLLNDATPDHASALAAEIVRSLRTSLAVEDIELSIDASVGIAMAPQHGESLNDLLRSAEIALAEAKSAKTSIEWAQEVSSGDTPRSRLVLLGDLRHAIEEHELRVYFQPKVRLEDRGLHGVEALVRWPHPVYGFVSPAEFIAAAEQTGLIRELTDYVLDSSLRQCQAWLADGLELRVAVNVSTRNLLDVGFADRVRTMLNEHNLRGEYLVLEITEGTLMQNPELGRQAIEKLKALGVEIALDDFGTGFSSLSYLNMLPIDELKIDRAFLAGIAEESTNRAVIRAAIQLGQDLGIRVVVEGIEQEAEAEVLISLGCDLGQGYLFGKPMPADEISALVGGKVRFGAARKARPKPRPRALTRSGAGTAAADDGS